MVNIIINQRKMIFNFNNNIIDIVLLMSLKF